MSAAFHVRQDDPASESTPSEGDLLDVLYEVLAQGVPAGSQLTSAEVERFLHEHARSPKPVGEMLAFFARHGLPTDPAAYAAAPELRELASGLHRERPPSGMLALPEETEPPLPQLAESGEIRKALPPSEGVEESSTVRTRLEQQGRGAGGRAWKVATCLLALALVAGFAASFQRGQELQRELRQAHFQQRTTDDALSALEQRAEQLRGALSESEAERKELADRFESFAQEAERARSAEEGVLKRLLGPRYESLRQKALRETPAPATAPASP